MGSSQLEFLIQWDIQNIICKIYPSWLIFSLYDTTYYNFKKVN